MIVTSPRGIAQLLGVHELTQRRFYRDLLSEFIGTMILMFVICALGAQWDGEHPSVVQISLTAGFVVATIVWCLVNVSGSHVNPAISVAFAVGGHISPVRTVCYVASQCLGSVVAVVFAKALTPESLIGPYYAVNRLNPLVTTGQGVWMEAVCTFLLTITVFATIDQTRNDVTSSGPLAIGISVALTHLFGFKYTGSAINPARTFGPAFVANKWDDHWVYWVGPMLGSVVAVLLYQYVFAGDASPRKAKIALSCSGEKDIEPDEPDFEKPTASTRHMGSKPSLIASFHEEYQSLKNHDVEMTGMAAGDGR